MSVTSLLPEALRNARIQLRPKRMLAAALLAIIGSVTAYVSYHSQPAHNPSNLLEFLIIVEVTVLALGGGIYCLQSIHREKELNTFDYQRITRSTPLELTLGKLFGAPSLAYFIVLCLLPITLLAAFLSHVSLSTLLAIYVVILLGSITLHSLALLVSALTGRGSSAGAIVGFLILVSIVTSAGSVPQGSLALRSLSPYYADQLLNGGGSDAGDSLLGHPVPHFPVLIVLYLFFTAWFLLGLVRIIKRDPAFYEVYSPPQALCFVLCLDAIVILFFNWTRQSFIYSGQRPIPIDVPVQPAVAQSEFLGISLWLFALLALALLRNRERVRTRIKHLGAKASSLWAALWPAPYLLGGFLAAGLAMVAVIRYAVEPESGWSSMAIFEVCFVAAWITRDALYLQWMNLRRGRRPLITGFIYLIAFYACAAALSVPLRLDLPQQKAFLLPWAAFSLGLDGPSGPSEWTSALTMWIGALLILVLEALVFAVLQRAQLVKLRDSAAAAESAR